MEYTAPANPLTIPKDPNRDKPEQTSKTAKDTALKEGSPELFALSQDFEEDPTTANAVEVVSKPYAAQVQETFLNENPNISSDVPNLKGVQLAMLLKIIEKNFPEIGQSLKQYFDMSAPLGIHLLNLDYETYTECTYVEISVNKVKVRAIIDSRAPISIVSTCLVQKIGLAPYIAHRRVYGTVGLHTTTSEGAYSAISTKFGSIAVFLPAVILPSQNYNVLICTAFIHKYGVLIDM
ncbi:hypothetical protein DSO57_1035316 [Entomophthora muscae]|uniref:Uncharacterized protein n=1 Tax=Entomophthora muscae TaxID=34485 RepID=A0ACC2TLB7_9FUNG|nr:hypothetical protein DSO57_1035316 [Entomophthora muscae]